MSLDLNGWLLAASTGAALALALFGLAAAAQFPAEQRAPPFRAGGGALVLWGTILIAGASVALTLLAIRALPWPQTVLCIGAALLVAPLMLQSLPDRFVNGRRGLLAFSGLAVVLALAATRFTP